jgi:hypothetical protein
MEETIACMSEAQAVPTGISAHPSCTKMTSSGGFVTGAQYSMMALR